MDDMQQVFDAIRGSCRLIMEQLASMRASWDELDRERKNKMKMMEGERPSESKADSNVTPGSGEGCDWRKGKREGGEILLGQSLPVEPSLDREKERSWKTSGESVPEESAIIGDAMPERGVGSGGVTGKYWRPKGGNRRFCAWRFQQLSVLRSLEQLQEGVVFAELSGKRGKSFPLMNNGEKMIYAMVGNFKLTNGAVSSRPSEIQTLWPSMVVTELASVMARQRRRRNSDKHRCWQQLRTWDRTRDIRTMLARRRRQETSDMCWCWQKLRSWDRNRGLGTMKEVAFRSGRSPRPQVGVLHCMPYGPSSPATCVTRVATNFNGFAKLRSGGLKMLMGLAHFGHGPSHVSDFVILVAKHLWVMDPGPALASFPAATSKFINLHRHSNGMGHNGKNKELQLMGRYEEEEMEAYQGRYEFGNRFLYFHLEDKVNVLGGSNDRPQSIGRIRNILRMMGGKGSYKNKRQTL